MNETIMRFKALADETRLRAWAALQGRELCVCQLVEFLQLAPSTISKHLSLLYQAGLLERRKCGRWIYYRGLEANKVPRLGKMLASLFQALEKEPWRAADRRRLAAILKMNMEDVCRKIMKG